VRRASPLTPSTLARSSDGGKSAIVDRYEAEGLQGLIDKRLEQVSHRRAPVDEAMALVER